MATQQMKNQASQGVSYLLFDVLDIRVVLNQNTLINPEMQAINKHNRPERSLSFRASLYKTRAWEELHILSQNNEYLKKASETVYHLTQRKKSVCSARPERITIGERRGFRRGLSSLSNTKQRNRKEKAGSNPAFSFASKEKRPENPTSSSQFVFAILLLQKLL